MIFHFSIFFFLLSSFISIRIRYSEDLINVFSTCMPIKVRMEYYMITKEESLNIFISTVRYKSVLCFLFSTLQNLICIENTNVENMIAVCFQCIYVYIKYAQQKFQAPRLIFILFYFLLFFFHKACALNCARRSQPFLSNIIDGFPKETACVKFNSLILEYSIVWKWQNGERFSSTNNYNPYLFYL